MSGTADYAYITPQTDTETWAAQVQCGDGNADDVDPLDAFMEGDEHIPESSQQESVMENRGSLPPKEAGLITSTNATPEVPPTAPPTANSFRDMLPIATRASSDFPKPATMPHGGPEVMASQPVAAPSTAIGTAPEFAPMPPRAVAAMPATATAASTATQQGFQSQATDPAQIDLATMDVITLRRSLFLRPRPAVRVLPGVSENTPSLVQAGGTTVQISVLSSLRSPTQDCAHPIVKSLSSGAASSDELVVMQSLAHLFVDQLDVETLMMNMPPSDAMDSEQLNTLVRRHLDCAQLYKSLRSLYAEPSESNLTAFLAQAQAFIPKELTCDDSDATLLKAPLALPLLPADLVQDQQIAVPPQLLNAYGPSLADSILPTYQSLVLKRLHTGLTSSLLRIRALRAALQAQGLLVQDASGRFVTSSVNIEQSDSAAKDPSTVILLSQWVESTHEMLLWRLLFESYIYSGISDGLHESTEGADALSNPNKRPISVVDRRIIALLTQINASSSSEDPTSVFATSRAPPPPWKVPQSLIEASRAALEKARKLKNAKATPSGDSSAGSSNPSQGGGSRVGGVFSFLSRVVGGSGIASKQETDDSSPVSSAAQENEHHTSSDQASSIVLFEQMLGQVENSPQENEILDRAIQAFNAQYASSQSSDLQQCLIKFGLVGLATHVEQLNLSQIATPNPVSSVPGATMHTDLSTPAALQALNTAQALVMEGQRVEAVQVLVKARLWSSALALASSSHELGLVPPGLLQKTVALFANTVYSQGCPITIATATPQMLQQGTLLREVPGHARTLQQRRQQFAQRVHKETGNASTARASARFLGLATLAEATTPSVLRDWPLALGALYSTAAVALGSGPSPAAASTVAAAREAMTQLGDVLWSIHGAYLAAHVCYLLGGKLPPINAETPKQHDARVVALGYDHKLSPADGAAARVMISKVLRQHAPLAIVPHRDALLIAEVGDAVRARWMSTVHRASIAMKATSVLARAVVYSLPSAMYPLVLPMVSNQSYQCMALESPSALLTHSQSLANVDPAEVCTQGISASRFWMLLKAFISLLAGGSPASPEQSLAAAYWGQCVTQRWTQLVTLADAVYGPPHSVKTGAPTNASQPAKLPGQSVSANESIWAVLWTLRDQYGLRLHPASRLCGNPLVDDLASQRALQRSSNTSVQGVKETSSVGSGKIKEKVVSKFWNLLDKGISTIVASTDSASANKTGSNAAARGQSNEPSEEELHPLAPRLPATLPVDGKISTICDANELSAAQYAQLLARQQAEASQVMDTMRRSYLRAPSMGGQQPHAPGVTTSSHHAPQFVAQPASQPVSQPVSRPVIHQRQTSAPQLDAAAPTVPATPVSIQNVYPPAASPVQPVVSAAQASPPQAPLPPPQVRPQAPLPVKTTSQTLPLASPPQPQPQALSPVPPTGQSQLTQLPPSHFVATQLHGQSGFAPAEQSSSAPLPQPAPFPPAHPAPQQSPRGSLEPSTVQGTAASPQSEVNPQSTPAKAASGTKSPGRQESKPAKSAPASNSSSSRSGGLGAAAAAAASKVFSWFSSGASNDFPEDETKFVYDPQLKEWVEYDRHGNRVIRDENDKPPSSAPSAAAQQSEPPKPSPLPPPMPAAAASMGPRDIHAGVITSRYALSGGLEAAYNEPQAVEQVGFLAPRAPEQF